MKLIPDIQKLILHFTWGRPFCFEELFEQMKFVNIVQASITRVFFSPVVIEVVNGSYIPNPYREGFPHYDTKLLFTESIFDSAILQIPHQLKDTFYSNRYRRPIEKKIHMLYKTGFEFWNKVYFNFFVRIKITDLYKEDALLFDILTELEPFNRPLQWNRFLA